jgi:hypothetical protein
MDNSRYTLTVYVAAPGTPINSMKGETSLPGHMYYSTGRDGQMTRSYGFAPITHGQINGPGEVSNADAGEYEKPLYSRTIEIDRDQYDRLNAFGSDPASYGFSKHYQDVRNNCVDFTWAAIDHAGIKHRASLSVDTALGHGPDVRIPLPWDTEGKSSLRPARNVKDVEAIRAPFPDSELNSEKRNPMPDRSAKQWLLSDATINEPAHPGHGMYQQALRGVQELNKGHGVNASPRDHNFAGAIAVNARGEGLDRIDHVLLSDDASRTFAVQGPLHSRNGLDRQIAGMDTVQSLNTPLAQSSEAWAQADSKAVDMAHAQVQAQQQAQERASQQQGPTMSLA